MLPVNTGVAGGFHITDGGFLSLANGILLNLLPVDLSIVSTRMAEADITPELLAILMDAKIGVGAGWSADVVLKATRQQEIVGCCGLDFVYPASILHSLVVRRHMRRRGVGRELVDHAVLIAGEKGASTIVALTMFWNVGFFRKCGFETTSRKILPPCLFGNPLVFDPIFRYATPMKRELVVRAELATRGD